MITPSIGRVVWIQGRDISPKSSQPEPALISYVHTDRSVNVGGFNAHGQPFHAQSIPLLQDDDVAPETGVYASWMPYQKVQAEKVADPVAGSNFYQRGVASGEIPPLTPVTTAPVEGA